MKSYSLIKSTSWYAISKLIVLSLNFLSIPIFTHLLTTGDYGVVSLYTVWIGILTPIIGLGLHLSVSRAKIEFKDHFEQYVSSIISLVVGLFILSLLIIYIFRVEILAITKIPTNLLSFLVIQVLMSIFASIGLGLFQFQFQYKIVSIINVTRSVVSVLTSVLLIVFVFSNSRVEGKIIGVFIVELVLGCGIAIYLLRKGKVVFNYNYWKFGLYYSVPFVFGSLSFILNSQFDRILINEYIGSSETGLYSFAYSIGMLLLLLGVSVKQALNPWIYEKLDKETHEPVIEIYKQFIYVFSLVTILMLYISPELVQVLSAKDFWSSGKILPWIVLSAYFQLLILNEQETQMFLKKTALNSFIIVLGAIINIVLNYIVIPSYGVIGAAITTLVTYSFMFLIMYYVNSIILNYRLVNIKFYFRSISYVSLFSIVFFLVEDHHMIRLCIFLVTFFALVLYVIKERRNYLINKDS